MLKRLMGTTVLLGGLLSGGALWGHGNDHDDKSANTADMPGERNPGATPMAGSTGGNGTADTGSPDTGSEGKKASGKKKHKGAGGGTGGSSATGDTM